jgi:DNA end-binding protein Ku
MAQSIWSGTISFGLVSVPVRLYPATRKKDVRFHEIDRLTGQRIRHQRVRQPDFAWTEDAPPQPIPAPSQQSPSWTTPVAAPSEMPESLKGEEADETPAVRAEPTVRSEDILKGFEVKKGQYVTLEQQELEELAAEPSRTIDIELFVEAKAIDPIYFEASYYAVPDRDQLRSYALLLDAMAESKKAAVAWLTLRRKRHLAAIRPYGKLMLVSTMRYSDEIVPLDQFEQPFPGELSRKEREMALLLVNTLSGPFEPERFVDEYRHRILAAIEKRQPIKAAEAYPVSSALPDLMAALRASVEEAKKRRKQPPQKAARIKKAASRTGRRKSA